MGNLDAERDWGFAGDYVAAMWLMLQQDRARRLRRRHRASPHRSASCVEIAFERVGLDYETHVVIDPSALPARPRSTTCSGDAAKARTASSAGQPTVDFRELVEMMVDADLERLRT